MMPKKRTQWKVLTAVLQFSKSYRLKFRQRARAPRRLGLATINLANSLMGAVDHPAALESRRKAFAIGKRSLARSRNAQARFDLADAHGDLSEALTATGASTEALDQARQALSILQQLSAAD